MKLRFTPRALENITHIAEYLHVRNPSAARRVRDDLYDALRNLVLFPQVGRPQQTKDIRKLVTRRFAYLIYYTLDSAAAEIVVLGVKHPAQKREHNDA